MNWPLTSLIPATIELTQFVNNNWPNIWWYPYWYLGVPFRFISGPVVPLLTILIHTLTNLNLELAYCLLIALTILLGSAGIYSLVKELGGSRAKSWWAVAFFIFLPGQIYSLLTGSGLFNITISILPWIFYLFIKLIKSGSRLLIIFVAIIIAISLLINISSFLSIIVGLTILILIFRKMRALEEGMILLLLVLASSISLATIWYTPQFWFNLLQNPSFGGVPLTKVISFLMQLAQSLIPVVLGVWIVQTKIKINSRLTLFALLFSASFIFLSLVRFISDMDFWLDWLGYSLELQIGIAMLIPIILKRYINKYIVIVTTCILLTIIDILIGFQFYGRTYQARLEFKNQIKELVKNTDFNQRFFISGSPVFWLKSLLNSPIYQVRGNNDAVSTNSSWGMGAFNIREGENPQDLSAWLNIFGIKYLLLESDKAQDEFHDFKNINRFKDYPEIGEITGNQLFASSGSWARIVDKNLLQIKPVTKGNDTKALENYLNTFEQELPITISRPNQIEVSTGNTLPQGKLISLSVSYSPNWRIIQGQGKLVKDVVGNLLIIPGVDNSVFRLEYDEPIYSWLWGMVLCLFCLVLIYKKDYLISIIKKRFPSLAISTADEQNNY